MNRPIKFRAWDDKGKKWLLGYDTGSLGGFSLFGECMLLGEWEKVLEDEVHGAIDLKVMQFTGLTDKNGKEIYEGDILLFIKEGRVEGQRQRASESHHWRVYMSTEKGQWRARRSLAPSTQEPNGPTYMDSALWDKVSSHVIIGNIYENPDLLKV